MLVTSITSHPGNEFSRRWEEKSAMSLQLCSFRTLQELQVHGSEERLSPLDFAKALEIIVLSMQGESLD
jgi:hypothetical protein